MTAPLQSLAGRGRLARAEALAVFPRVGGFPTAWVRFAGFPASPLSRSWSVLQGLMICSSGLIGCPPRLRPLASRLGPCRFPASHSRRQRALAKVDSLHELNFSLRAPDSFARPVHRQPTKGTAAVQAPLLRSLPLQRPNSEQPLDPRSRAVPRDLPQPLRSVLVVSHDLDGFIRSEPCPSFLRHPLMGFFPSGFPASLRAASSLTQPPLMAFFPATPAFYGDESDSPCSRAGPPGSYSCDTTASASFMVSHPPGTVTLLGLLLEASLP